MLAESMLVGFSLRKMNRLVSTFFSHRKYITAFDTNIDLISFAAVSGYFFCQVMSAVCRNTTGPGDVVVNVFFCCYCLHKP